MIKKILSIAAMLLLINSMAAFSQVSAADSSLLKNEVGIDVANILTFLRKNTQSYLFNYKRHINARQALRFGLNLDLANEKLKGYYSDVRLGYEYKVNRLKWQYFTGADISGAYAKSNLQPNRNYRWGLSPLLGVKYHFSPRFSASSEAKLNFFYSFYRDPGSFDAAANSEDFQINIGSVGMVQINYHLNFRD